MLTREITKRAACKEYGLHWTTLRKVLEPVEPPGYRRAQSRAKPKLGPFLPWIHEVQAADRSAPPKQRHTAQRIFDRLRTEQGYTGGVSVVKDTARAWKQSRREVFVPLSHPPGEAQVDFGFAYVDLAGEPICCAFRLFSGSCPSSRQRKGCRWTGGELTKLAHR